MHMGAGVTVFWKTRCWFSTSCQNLFAHCLQVVGARGCTLAVVAGAAAKQPAGVPAGVLCVREEWLLSAAAGYCRPPHGFAVLEA